MLSSIAKLCCAETKTERPPVAVLKATFPESEARESEVRETSIEDSVQARSHLETSDKFMKTADFENESKSLPDYSPHQSREIRDFGIVDLHGEEAVNMAFTKLNLDTFEGK